VQQRAGAISRAYHHRCRPPAASPGWRYTRTPVTHRASRSRPRSCASRASETERSMRSGITTPAGRKTGPWPAARGPCS
jgi:hypothetical protein